MKKTNLRYDIFISYRRSSAKGIARSIKEALKTQGLSVFLDLDELKDGHFMDVIYSALNNSKIFMVILSEDIFDRCSDDDCVRKEIEYALEKGLHIIPVNPDKQFKGFPEDFPSSIRNSINQHQFSAIDTDQLFTASIEKMVNERITPIVNSSSGTAIKKSEGKRKRIFKVAVVFTAIVALLLSGWFYFEKASLYDSDPQIQLDKADKKTEKIPKPKRLVTNGASRKIVETYRDVAMRCDQIGNDNYSLFSSSSSFSNLEEAYYHFHSAGYAWQSIEEYDNSIWSYSSAIHVANLIISNFPEENGLSWKSYSLNNMAYSYCMQGNKKKAIETIDEAIAINPNTLDYLDSKGELLYLSGEYESALEIWEHIQSVDKYFHKNDWVDKSKTKIDAR